MRTKPRPRFRPLAPGGPGASALVGMGAVVPAATHAPITSILIIFELTNDYKIMLPLMISCIIATLLATRLQDASIYTLKLLRRGIDIRSGKALNVLEHVSVREEMRSDLVRVSRRDSIVALISRLLDHAGNTLFVVDERDRLLGLVTADEIRPVMADAASMGGLIIADDVMAPEGFPIIAPDESLADAMRVLGTYRGEVPVVEEGRLVGALWPETLIERYNSETFKRDMAHSMASTMTHGRKEELLPAVQNTVVSEIPAPAAFIGKSIRELDIRRRFGVSVLMIKRATQKGGAELHGAAGAEYVFRAGDIMLALGSPDGLRDLQRGRAQSEARS